MNQETGRMGNGAAKTTVGSTEKGPWIDVSIPVRPGMTVWPGDPPVEIVPVSSLSVGDPCAVSRLSLGTHTGTHVDAPAHVVARGATVDEIPTDVMVGAARVIDLRRVGMIRADTLHPHHVREGERLLLKTRGSRGTTENQAFDGGFAHLDQTAARHLAQLRVRLIGVDAPSVSAFHEDPAPVHGALLSAGVWIVEGLDLREIEPGRYDFICLPLRVVGADGAPARALLRRRR